MSKVDLNAVLARLGLSAANPGAWSGSAGWSKSTEAPLASVTVPPAVPITGGGLFAGGGAGVGAGLALPPPPSLPPQAASASAQTIVNAWARFRMVPLL